MPETKQAPKGSVYCFGGLESTFAFQPLCFKYNIAKDKWTALPELEDFRMSYNLLPLLEHRYILLVSQAPCVMLDTHRDTWIKVEMHPED